MSTSEEGKSDTASSGDEHREEAPVEARRHPNKDTNMMHGSAPDGEDNDVASVSLHSDNTSKSHGFQPAYHRSHLLEFKGDRYLKVSKVLLFVILSVAATAGAYFVYTQSVNEEEKAYELGFDEVASVLLAATKINGDATVETYKALSLSITTFASSLGPNAFPFVTMPEWEATSEQVINQTGTTSVGFSVFVKEEQRTVYEQYKLNNTQWIHDSAAYAGVDPETVFVAPFIHSGRLGAIDGQLQPSEATDRGVLCPVAQVAPIQSSWLVNYDGFSNANSGRLYETIQKTRDLTFSYVLHTDGTTDRMPQTFIGLPIMDRVGPEGVTAGALTGSIEWHRLFEGLLPDNVGRVVLVISNSCGQVFTLHVDGPDVTLAGEGDLHKEPPLSFMESIEFNQFSKEDICRYTIAIFPSQDFYDQNMTNRPIINTVTVLAAFLLTATIFVVYDVLVERRQRHLMNTATKSDAIVSSLFPSNVRDRLMMENGIDGAGEKKKKANAAMKNWSMILHESSHTSAGQSKLGSWEKTEPIADLFPHATVLFADMVGFTAWSSTRSPGEVFTLLETLYGSFDKIARRIGVFKVETIGDCYMAATGLPEPNPDHAAVMVRFARLCLSRMGEVLPRLAEKFGPSTMDLTMRVGIHSGPVTGGVLRGEKSRFQLFGDTVNTAARMESTGAPARIQVSQETADELVKAGRVTWLSPREDTVVAKGKGEMRTYWINRSPADETNTVASKSVSGAGSV